MPTIRPAPRLTKGPCAETMANASIGLGKVSNCLPPPRSARERLTAIG